MDSRTFYQVVANSLLDQKCFSKTQLWFPTTHNSTPLLSNCLQSISFLVFADLFQQWPMPWRAFKICPGWRRGSRRLRKFWGKSRQRRRKTGGQRKIPSLWMGVSSIVVGRLLKQLYSDIFLFPCYRDMNSIASFRLLICSSSTDFSPNPKTILL